MSRIHPISADGLDLFVEAGALQISGDALAAKVFVRQAEEARRRSPDALD